MKPLAPLLAAATLAAAPSAQTELAPGTIAVVTSDGLFLPDAGSAVPDLHVPAASFLPGGQLDRARIEWLRGTDSFLVATRDGLWVVSVTDLAGQTTVVENITPGVAPLDLFDLDLHTSTGELYLLDQAGDRVLRFEPPFAAGMLPNLEIPVGASARSMAVDSRGPTPSLLVSETGIVRRILFNGFATTVSFATTDSIDQDAQSAGLTYFSGQSSSMVGVAGTSPSGFVDMNFGPGCDPLLPSPRGLAWDPMRNRALVYSEEPLHFQCASMAAGGHHVLAFPTAQVPGVVTPTVKTHAADSGITGSGGDVTVVLDDFAFVSPYGESCFIGSPAGFALDVAGSVEVTDQAISIRIEGAEPGLPIHLLFGFAPLDALLAGGCTLYTDVAVIFALGPADPQGELELLIPVNVAPFLGVDLFTQAAQILPPNALLFSQGLRVHIGL